MVELNKRQSNAQKPVNNSTKLRFVAEKIYCYSPLATKHNESMKRENSLGALSYNGEKIIT